MIEVIIYFSILAIYLNLPTLDTFRKSRTIRFNAFLVVVSIALFLYSCVQILINPTYMFGLNLTNLNLRKTMLLVWITTFVTLYSFNLTNYYWNYGKNKKGPTGDKGIRGDRGKIGSNKTCDPKECTKDICYKKILKFCSKTYKQYLKAANKITEGTTQITNQFLLKKMKKLCNSEQFQTLLKIQGSSKAYAYVFKTWKTWLYIILKYENGHLFLQNDYLTDNDFDNMITEVDTEYADFNDIEVPGTPSKGAQSPFDEIKKYDMWYWGENVAAMPKIIYKCDIPDITGTLKKVESNHYDTIWESKDARQAHINRGKLVEGKCVKQMKYVPSLQKGSDKVTVYRPELLNFKEDNYYPLGDVIFKGKSSDISKKLSSENEPNIQGKLRTQGPKDKTVLVSGDVKHPVDFKPIFKAPRTKGEGVGLKGFSIWEPIPPAGYKCLGYVIDNSPNIVPPDLESVVCVPDKCVRKTQSDTPKVWSNNSPVECLGDCGCDTETGVRDTDNATPLNLFKTKNHIFKNEISELYELIPEGEEGSCFDAAKEKQTDVSQWKVNPKNNSKYSIFNIYNLK
jgi:hypothetical protein